MQQNTKRQTQAQQNRRLSPAYARYSQEQSPPRAKKVIGGFLAFTILVMGFVAWQRDAPPSQVASSDGAANGVQSAQVDNGPLQAKLAETAGTYSADYSIAVTELAGDGRSATHRGDEPMAIASIYKIFVAYGVLRDIEQGDYSLATTTSLGKTVEDCLDVMIRNSDNDCGRVLGFLTEWQDLDAQLRAIGLANTVLDNYPEGSTLPVGEKTSTASDITLFLRKLEAGELLNKTHTSLLLESMKNQQWRERINSGVPENIEVANKPGWLPDVQADAGIVYAPSGTFVIVILSNSNNPANLAEITADIYAFLAA
jgi:beta-lactamase class A